MNVIKCKMCGGNLILKSGSTIAECESCGTVQTVPSVGDEKKLLLFARANRLRMNCEFDKAAGIYEAIVADFPEEAEAYWGIVLCKFGIEYVDDAVTKRKIPTCHRTSFSSVLEDENYEQALENADGDARKIYRSEAKQIEEIRKGIIEVSSKEKPYDIFICYKEKDEDGNRTLDSVWAQDIYDALTDKGYRVFFSRITLEDKLGEQYEPYIFAALNSAKIMLVVGTDYDYFNAVWVKNEWRRFLMLMVQDNTKHLIPCFKNIEANDMPKEFNKLQAQDLGKLGAMQDLLRGVERLLPKKEEQPVKEHIYVSPIGNKIESLLHRGNMALEDGDWAKADSFFEDVLNNDSKNAQAYLGKTLAVEKCRTMDAMVRKRLALTEKVEVETLQIEPDTNHIEEMVERYTIPGYVDKEEILKFYEKDFTYQTVLPGRKKQKEEEECYWINHKWLSKAEKFASLEIKAVIEDAKKNLFTQMNERIVKAENRERETIATVKKCYEEYIVEGNRLAIKLYNDGKRRREIEYQCLVERAKAFMTDWEELRELAERFDAMENYEDSRSMAIYCRKRLKKLDIFSQIFCASFILLIFLAVIMGMIG